jgi:hypothetical protein
MLLFSMLRTQIVHEYKTWKSVVFLFQYSKIDYFTSLHLGGRCYRRPLNMRYQRPYNVA